MRLGCEAVLDLTRHQWYGRLRGRIDRGDEEMLWRFFCAEELRRVGIE